MMLTSVLAWCLKAFILLLIVTFLIGDLGIVREEQDTPHNTWWRK